MYYSLLAIVAQITVLVSLVRAPFPDYDILYWYIPNYIGITFIILNNISSANHLTSYSVLALLGFVGNFLTTIAYGDRDWCGAAPTVVTLCFTAALDLHRQKISKGVSAA